MAGQNLSPLRGLSPRVRGKPDGLAAFQFQPRSIPACAGEARKLQHRRLKLPVYPRVCGGSRSLIQPMPIAAGLSPRVRGKPKREGGVSRGRRSIPACAGEASTALMLLAMAGVYPRVCGGSPKALTDRATDDGLSPRVRGKPQRL